MRQEAGAALTRTAATAPPSHAVAPGVEGAAEVGREQFHGGKAGQRAVVGQFDAEDEGVVHEPGADQAARRVEGESRKCRRWRSWRVGRLGRAIRRSGG